MKKEIGGKTYVQVPELRMCSCDGCVTTVFSKLCKKLREGGIHSCAGKIFKEQTMSEQKEKTALELVDELIEGKDRFVGTDELRDIKSAIEWEQKNEDDEYSALLQISADRARIIVDLTAQLKSAITMRPISELPDRVPDGCVIVVVNDREYVEHISHGITGLRKHFMYWEPGILNRKPPTHFYILPLPKAERKLHPCYMPGCGGSVTAINGVEKTDWRITCTKCGMLGPIFNTKEKAELEWGHEE